MLARCSVFVVTLWLLPVIFPVDVKAQRASVSISSSQLQSFGYLNGGGAYISADNGLDYSGSLNVIDQPDSSPIIMSVNGHVIANGTPTLLQKMSQSNDLYQHKLNPALAQSTINLNGKTSVSIQVGGTSASYRWMIFQSQDTIRFTAMGQALSVFPVVLPSVFDKSADQ